ncbi:MAG: DNA-directed RNA polymerase subunit alpha C-terminal domain-containing protein [Desulfobacteraceae bacterium]|jgi:hypothetical protein
MVKYRRRRGSLVNSQQVRLIAIALALSASGVGYYFAGQSDITGVPLLAIVAILAFSVLFILELRKFQKPQVKFRKSNWRVDLSKLGGEFRPTKTNPMPPRHFRDVSPEAIADEVVAKVMQRYGINLSNEPTPAPVAANPAPPKTATKDIKTLGLSGRTVNLLRSAGIDTVEDLSSRWSVELLGIDGFGRKSLQEVRRQLKGQGLRLS